MKRTGGLGIRDITKAPFTIPSPFSHLFLNTADLTGGPGIRDITKAPLTILSPLSHLFLTTADLTGGLGIGDITYGDSESEEEQEDEEDEGGTMRVFKGEKLIRLLS